MSYSRRDSEYLDRLLVHLKPLERNGLIDLWSDTKIAPGASWKIEISAALEAAAVAILLVSADFLASDFIVHNELPPLLAAARGGGAKILPVIVKPSRFSRDESLSQFHAINDPNVPLIAMDAAGQQALFARLAAVVEDHVRG